MGGARFPSGFELVGDLERSFRCEGSIPRLWLV